MSQRKSPGGFFSPEREILTREEILAEYVKDWFLSEKRREMGVGRRYYFNQNDIKERKRFMIGGSGELIEDRSANNRRISHNFLRKLIDQKAQYLFGRDFSIVAQNEAFAKTLNGIFDPALRATMKNVCKEAVMKGVSWLFCTVEDGKIRFRKLSSENIIPIEDRGKLTGVLWLYQKEWYQGKQKEKKTFAEYWSEEGVETFLYENGKLIPDVFTEKRPHFLVNGSGYNLPSLPFISFPYNEEEVPLIHFIKDLIDDYDLLKSEDTNTLLDNPGALLVLKNYDGTDLGEFRKNLSRYKIVKVSDDGGISVERTPNATDAVLAHLLADRKDIYELGRGVDTQNEQLGTASGVAMRFLYTDLDLDCSGIESQFKAGFSKMVDFIAFCLQIFGEGDFMGEKAEILLNRDMISNEGDAIEQCLQSQGLLSLKTVLSNHPWVTNIEEELKRLQEEKAQVSL